MNKKIKSIINENLLYAFRENVLVWPIFVYIILMVVFFTVWDSAIVSTFKNVTYISMMSNIQYILWVIVIIFISLTSFDKDIKTKNIYIILQQVTKKEYFLWKLISIFLLSWLLNLIFLLIFSAWYIYSFKEIDFSLAYIFIFQQLEFLVISFLVSLIALLFTKNIWRIMIIWMFLILWHMLSLIKELIDKWFLDLGFFLEKIITLSYYVMPNLAALNVKNIILLDSNLFWMLVSSTIYSAVLIYILYVISMYIFKRKDF